MKVHQLIEILDELDSDGDVYIMVQPEWPFECALSGVAIREDFTVADEEDGEPTCAPGDRWTTPASMLPRNDVFLVVGDQVRYGDGRAWDVVRRR